MLPLPCGPNNNGSFFLRIYLSMLERAIASG